MQEVALKFIGDVGLSFLGLLAYIVFKVWSILGKSTVAEFVKENRKFWFWHIAATLVMATIYWIDPEGEFVTMLQMFGVNLEGSFSFLILGLALAEYAYNRNGVKDSIEKYK